MLVSELLPRDANNAEEYYKNLRLAEKRQAEERTATGPKKGKQYSATSLNMWAHL
jgi:hypothetical protein